MLFCSVSIDALCFGRGGGLHATGSTALLRSHTGELAICFPDEIFCARVLK